MTETFLEFAKRMIVDLTEPHPVLRGGGVFSHHDCSTTIFSSPPLGPRAAFNLETYNMMIRVHGEAGGGEPGEKAAERVLRERYNEKTERFPGVVPLENGK